MFEGGMKGYATDSAIATPEPATINADEEAKKQFEATAKRPGEWAKAGEETVALPADQRPVGPAWEVPEPGHAMPVEPKELGDADVEPIEAGQEEKAA